MNRVGYFVDGHVKLKKEAVPSLEGLPPGTCIVRNIYSSICGSDVGRVLHPDEIDLSPGGSIHEVLGEVVQIHQPEKDDYDHPPIVVGDIVLALPSHYFRCGFFRGFDDRIKKDLKVIPPTGGLCDFFLSHTSHVFILPETNPKIPMHHFLAAQPIGTLLWMARKLPNILFKDVVIVGGGQNGLLLTNLISNLGARRIIVIEVLENRMEAARKMKATHVIDGRCSDEDVVSKVEEIVPNGADYVFEMVGHQDETLKLCLDLVKEGGSVFGFGVPSGPVLKEFPFAKVFRKNLRLIGSVFPNSREDFRMGIEWVAQGRMNVSVVVQNPSYQFHEFDQAFVDAGAKKGDILKLVIQTGTEEPQRGIVAVDDGHDDIYDSKP
eukprot:m.68889 g.68889  ORF g.68889 m.68889 type:complete len:379 (-) comp8258_c13_seq3:80-1216(-)